eukprot:UN29914
MTHFQQFYSISDIEVPSLYVLNNDGTYQTIYPVSVENFVSTLKLEEPESMMKQRLQSIREKRQNIIKRNKNKKADPTQIKPKVVKHDSKTEESVKNKSEKNDSNIESVKKSSRKDKIQNNIQSIPKKQKIKKTAPVTKKT